MTDDFDMDKLDRAIRQAFAALPRASRKLPPEVLDHDQLIELVRDNFPQTPPGKNVITQHFGRGVYAAWDGEVAAIFTASRFERPQLVFIDSDSVLKVCGWLLDRLGTDTPHISPKRTPK